MESIVFTITDKENGLAALNYICEAIKGREDADHKLFFSRRLMGMYIVFNGKADDADREVIFCPSGRLDQLKGKNVIDTRNCMWFVGESDIKRARLQGTIDWLLKKDSILENENS